VSFEGGEVRTLAQAGLGVGLETPERGRPVRALEVEAALTRTVQFKLSRGEQISIPRYDLYPDHRPELAEAGLSSLVALPVQRPGVEGGALLLFKTQSHWLPDLQTRELLQDMAAAIGIVRQERLLQEELSWAAYTDPLTGLGNRRAFERDLENLHRLDSGRLLMLALLDLDGFKAINDTHGHVHADHVLVRLGATLKAKARAGDRAYRLGGDEFALIIEGSASLDVSRTAERYRFLVEEIKVADGEYLKASLGYAVLPGDAQDLADLWRVADDRMYDDKALRRLLGGAASSPQEARRNSSKEPLSPEPSTPLSRLTTRLGQAAGLGPAELQALAWAVGPAEASGEVVTLPQAVLREAMALLGAQYERWDGKGLPQGLAGESIPLAVRVLQVARDYLRLGGSAVALAALRAEARKAYDPRLVQLLAQIVGTPPDR
jgi:diguanylate cyclase (GGDEF)-like protein